MQENDDEIFTIEITTSDKNNNSANTCIYTHNATHAYLMLVCVIDLLGDLVPRRCSSTQRQLLHESSPCSSILSGTSSILYGKIQQSTVFF